MKICKQCKNIGCDYEFDGFNEDIFYFCSKNHDEYFGTEDKCPYFKKGKTINYFESDSVCDICECFHECIEKYGVFDMTEPLDERKHYGCLAGSECKK